MKNGRRLNFAVAVVLVFALMFPQGVFAVTHGTSKPTAKYAAGELIFKTKGNTQEEAKILRKYKLNIKRRDSRLGYILASTPSGADIQGVVKKLQKEEKVEYAQLNYKYEFFGKSKNPQYLGPNDPQYSRQWAMPKINVQQGWSMTKANSGIIVAVLDSGVDVNHPDLKNRLVQGTNTVNPLKSARDDDGHGTHIAGIIGAANNNGIGVTGIAGIPGVRIMPVKVFDSSGGSDISISDGIIWAADHGAKVMNMSFGSYFRSDVLNDAIDYAYNKGIVMVAAAGNWASQDISYPAALSKVIAVSATDKNDQLADFSSYGPQIDISAPGKGIYSTYWDQYKGSTYTELSGTSMASPMVAGLAALILAKNPKLTSDEVRQIIEVSATDLGDSGWDTKYGHGRINAQKALSLTLTKQDDSNGSMLKAVKLGDGVPYQEKINSGNDIDWYKIQVPDKGNLQIEVLPAGKVSPGVEAYDSEGTLIASFNAGGSGNQSEKGGLSPLLSFNAAPAGSIKVAQAVYGLVTNLDEGAYYIKIFGNHFRWSEENYTIVGHLYSNKDMVKDTNELNDNYETAKPLEVASKATGAILDSNDEDWFKIKLNAGTAYRVHLNVPGGLDLAVEVESATNYQEPSNEEEWKSYDDRWYWEVINSAGQSEDEDSVIITPDNGGGTYYIKVTDISGAAVNANYNLTIQSFKFTLDKYEENDTYEFASPVKIGDEISANFHSLDDIDWFSFEAPGTGILKFELQEPPGVVCSVELYSDPEGEPDGQNLNDFSFNRDNDASAQGPQVFEFKVAKGKYYLAVTNLGNVSADNYTLKTQYNSFDFTDVEPNDKPSKANPISLNETKTGTLYPENDVEFYALDIEKPQPLLVSLAPPADLDTVAVVLKQDTGDEKDQGKGKTEDTPGDSANESGIPEDDEPILQIMVQINSGVKGQLDTGVFVATKPGRYYIGVAASGELYQGQQAPKSLSKYALTVKPFKVQPDGWESNGTMDKAKAVTNGVAVHPTFMGTEDIDWFKVYAPGKGKLSVNLAVPSDIDGVLEVYNSTAKQLVKVDQSMVGEEEFTTLNVPKAGYYYIKAYDYLGNSSVQTYTLVSKFTKS